MRTVSTHVSVSVLEFRIGTAAAGLTKAGVSELGRYWSFELLSHRSRRLEINEPNGGLEMAALHISEMTINSSDRHIRASKLFPRLIFRSTGRVSRSLRLTTVVFTETSIITAAV